MEPIEFHLTLLGDELLTIHYSHAIKPDSLCPSSAVFVHRQMEFASCIGYALQNGHKSLNILYHTQALFIGQSHLSDDREKPAKLQLNVLYRKPSIAQG